MQRSETLIAVESSVAAQATVRGWSSALWRFCRRKPLGALGGLILLSSLICALFAPQIAPYGYNETILEDRLQGPSVYHLLGTDQLGRDLFSRVVYGARVSVVIGISSVAISIVIGVILGGVAGFAGGLYDLGLLRLIDAWLALPTLVIALTLVAVFGQQLVNIVIVLGLASGIQLSRVVRSSVLSVKNQQFMEAARTIGAGEARAFIRHVLPNIVPVLIVLATTALGSVILAEASLSFLGFGVPPPRPTWGGMLTGSAVQYMVSNPGMVIFPGIALGLTVYGANMFGDALRDVLDPRLRGT